MKNHGKIFLTAVLLAGAVSCNDGIAPENALPIQFTASLEGADTKAFLNAGDLSGSTELTVHGFKGNSHFIDNKKASLDVSGGWNLADTYYWESGSAYSFFAWLSKDKDGNAAPSGASLNGRALSIPAKTFDFVATDNDFDFCYSEVEYRPATSADHSPVSLSLKHLYTAIGFSAHNYTGSEITVKEVSLVGMKKQKSATINFEDTGTKVDYKVASVVSGSKKLNGGIITLAKDRECANIVGVASDTPAYYMFWPQTSEELTAQGWSDSGTKPGGGAYIKVVYSQGGHEIIRYARFPQDNDGTADLGWPAGTKRMMQLAFREEQITLKMQVLDWEYSEPEIKYDEEVTVAQVLQFDSSSCTIDEDQHKVFFNNLSTPVIGRFRLSAPSEATWIISKQGDFDAFEIDDVTPDANGKTAGRYGDHLDRNYGTVNETDGNSFTLYPMPVSAEGDYSIQLSFSIRYPDGESYCIDDKVQPGNAGEPVNKWTIVFTK